MSKLGKTLMVQGTASNVGKSVITSALCRILLRQGYRVAPFKAQNMSNNSYIASDGGELGRAQAVQAEACKIEPSVHMNPVLLKPDTDMKAQVIELGRPVEKIRSIGEKGYQKRFEPVVLDSLEHLRSNYDVVVIEGAGSPAEMNLKKRDIVNMNLAKKVKSPVVLVGDIDWGGIFAQLVGTHELLDPDEKRLVKCFLINKFRGDKKILDPGVKWIERRTRKSVLGVIPFLSDLDLAEEDSIGSDSSTIFSGLRGNVKLDAISGKGRDRREIRARNDQLLIDVMWLPRISNFTDFQELEKEHDVVLRYLHEPDRHSRPDLIIIPGTKSTMADLAYLKKSGLADYVVESARSGVPVLGICGGYQMLGKTIRDESKVESKQEKTDGLGLLPVHTNYQREKVTVRVKAHECQSGLEITGYEIHMGRTSTSKRTTPFFNLVECDGRRLSKTIAEGAILEDARSNGLQTWIGGTYIHGLFDDALYRREFLNRLRDRAKLKHPRKKRKKKSDIYDQLADHVEQNINLNVLMKLVGKP